MGQITQLDVARIKNALVEQLELDTSEGRCLADKERLSLLLDILEKQTDEVEDKALALGIIDSQNSLLQWQRDMQWWRARIGIYRQTLSVAQHTQGTASCVELKTMVGDPLVKGVYPPGLPGLNYNPNKEFLVTYPDIVTPYMLGNQVDGYGEHMQEAFSDLMKGLIFCPAVAFLTKSCHSEFKNVVDYWTSRGSYGSDPSIFDGDRSGDDRNGDDRSWIGVAAGALAAAGLGAAAYWAFKRAQAPSLNPSSRTRRNVRHDLM